MRNVSSNSSESPQQAGESSAAIDMTGVNATYTDGHTEVNGGADSTYIDTGYHYGGGFND